MNVNQVLDWIKSNAVIVVLVAVMIVALIAFPMYSKGKNADVQERVETRKRLISDLEKLDKTSFVDPVTGESHQIAVNEALLRRYEQVIEFKRRDGEQVLAQAITFNRGDHQIIKPATWSDTLGPWLFPAPPAEQKEVRPRQFHELLIQRYQQLLTEIGAGTPPDPQALAEELVEKESQFRLHSLSKTAEETLDEQDQRKLTEHLQAYRLQRYEEVAASISLYASLDAIAVPQFNQSAPPGLAELFHWQWQFWMVSDVLRALADANTSDSSVLQAPVKRVLAVGPTDAPSVSVTESTAGAGGSGMTAGGGGMTAGGGGMAAGGGGGRSRRPIPGAGTMGSPTGPSGTGPDTGAPAQPIDPNKPVPIDYSVSLTGRTSNHLYDVRYVRLSIIADTTRLPLVVNALAGRNFITVLDLTMKPVDPFEHIRQGYMYGTGTLSQVDMVLETIWLRQWTSESMPDELKRTLSIPVQQTGANTPGSMQG